MIEGVSEICFLVFQQKRKYSNEPLPFVCVVRGRNINPKERNITMKELTCTQMEMLKEACLANKLSEKQQILVIRHLQECPQCRKALEEARARTPKPNPVQEAQERPKQKSFSWFGVVCVGFMLLIVGGVLLPALTRSRESGHYVTVEGNLKQWGLIFKMYVNDSPGEKFPPLTQHDDLWVPDLNVLYPEHLTDPYLASDPSNSDISNRMYDIMSQNPPDLEEITHLMAQTYVYPGWLVHKNDDLEMIKQFRTADDIHIGDVGKYPDKTYWMRKGIERFLITDINNPEASTMAQSLVSVMIARPRPGRSTRESLLSKNPQKIVVPVLFLDGHVENIPLEDAPDHIKALVELFPEPLEAD